MEFAEIKVVVEQTYLVPVINGKTLNGWTIDELTKDWFQRHDINAHHASRSAYKLGGGDKIISHKFDKIIDVPDGNGA